MTDASAQDAAEEDRLRDEGREALHAGRYPEAFSKFHASVLSRAIRYFREEGVTFHRPPVELSPTELVVGLAMAAEDEYLARGDGASNKIAVATWLFQAAADLRLALDEAIAAEDEPRVHGKVAELILRGVVLGQVDGIMCVTELGWIDKLAEHEINRAKKKLGAERTNAQKRDVRSRAHSEAVRIANRNPTLSHEELALKVRDAAELNTTIKTLTDWIRGWRREGSVPPIKSSAR